jgi:multiple sugar transport system substrate-binding protein
MTRRRWLQGGMALSAGLAAACGVGGRPTGDTAQAGGPIKPEASTVVWLYWANPPDRKVIHDSIITRFQSENPTVKVEGVDPPQGAGTYLSKVAVQVAAGQPLDIIGSSPVWVPDNVGAGVVKELDGFVARDKPFKLDDYAKGVVDTGSWKSKLYFLAVFSNFNVLYYNKTLFDRSGVKYPDDTWTNEQVLDAARRLTQTTGDPTTAVFGFNFARDLNNISPYIWNNGGNSFDRPEDPARATMSSPASLEALQWLADLINRHKVAPGEGGAPQPNFQSGRIAMQTMPVNSIGAVATAAQFPWDITLIPKGKAGRQNYAGTLFYGVCSITKAPDAAWTLLKTICGSYGAGLHVQAQIGAPALKGMDREYQTLPPPPANRKAVLDTLPLLRALPKVRGMNDIYADVFTQTLNEAWRGEVSATEAARIIDERATALIKK